VAPTLGQRRGAFALRCVRKVGDRVTPREQADPGEVRKAAEFGQLIRKTPALILTNGIAQATAYLQSVAEGKADHPAGMLYKALEDWVVKERGILSGTPGAGRGLTDLLVDGSRSAYLAAHTEALALLGWMTKFADAFLPKPEASAQSAGEGEATT
jgi:CRISPR-associated protein Cmr5